MTRHLVQLLEDVEIIRLKPVVRVRRALGMSAIMTGLTVMTWRTDKQPAVAVLVQPATAN